MSIHQPSRNPETLLWIAAFFLALPGLGCSAPQPEAAPESRQSEAPGDNGEERHLANIRQLTFEGDNGEAYFSADGKRLIYQSKLPGMPYDQIFIMDLDGSNKRMVSTGRGRTTCSYFDPMTPRILYSSTHEAKVQAQEPAGGSRGGGGYDWQFDANFDIYQADLDGNILGKLTDIPGYDAEATYSPSGSRIVFTSNRDGDVEIYSMARDGGDVRRLTDMPGYDGGAFYSPDETRIIFRGARGEDYRELQLYVMNADGSGVRQLTHYEGRTSFAPYWSPSGKKVIFSSNWQSPRNFDLFLLDLETGEVERVTTEPSFDGFPVFSPDGKQLVFASNRAAAKEGDTHIFIADWVE